jgi:hypothetical protein
MRIEKFWFQNSIPNEDTYIYKENKTINVVFTGVL